MSKKRKKPSAEFGNSLQEVDQKIQSLEDERKSLADKLDAGNLSNKENKRFDQIGDILVDANNFRTEFQTVPGEERPADEFEVDKKVVIGEDKNPPGALSAPTATSALPQSNTSLVPANQAAPLTSGIDLGGGDPTGGVQVPTDIDVQAPIDPTQQIVQETLGGIQRPATSGAPDIGKEISTATFGQPARGAGAGKLRKPSGDPLIEQGARTTLGVNDPILKGNVGGQIIGNQPVFVGGGDFVAFDVLNNRKKAIQDAANVRDKEAQELLSRKPPMIKDQAFQGSLNNQFYSQYEGYIKRAQDEFGEDWDLVLKDQTNPLGREFVQSMDNFEFVAAASDQVTDEIAEVEADLESGDQIFSDETLQLLDDYKSLQNQFANGEIGGQISLRDSFDKLQGFKGLDRTLKDDAIDIKGTVTQFASILEDSEKFVTTTQKKTAYEDQLKVISKDIAENQLRDPVRRGLISEDEIFQHMNNLYGYENIISKKIKTKPTGAGIKINLDLNQEFGEEKIEKVGGADFTVVDAIEVPTGVKPLSASGLTVINPDGTTSKVDGVRDVDLNSFQVVKVPSKNDPNKFDLIKGVVGTHTERVEVADGKFEDKTFTSIYSMDEIGSRIKTDQLQEPEQWNQMNSRFDQIIEGEPELPVVDSKGR